MKISDHPMHPVSTKDEELKIYTHPTEPLMDLPTIPEFYKDQEIFISGGSGFMGKVLIEKLLRSCPGIKKIYVLLRPKKGKSIEERLEILINLLLFEPLKLTNANAFEKLVPIAGDVTELGLGLSASDVKLMENVSIIFHSAASVRFDDPLKAAVIMNTRGTREMIKFAENLKNIKVMMHVSTTYCNTDRPVIEEQIYPVNLLLSLNYKHYNVIKYQYLGSCRLERCNKDCRKCRRRSFQYFNSKVQQLHAKYLYIY